MSLCLVNMIFEFESGKSIILRINFCKKLRWFNGENGFYIGYMRYFPDKDLQFRLIDTFVWIKPIKFLYILVHLIIDWRSTRVKHFSKICQYFIGLKWVNYYSEFFTHLINICFEISSSEAFVHRCSSK